LAGSATQVLPEVNIKIRELIEDIKKKNVVESKDKGR